MTPAQVHSLVAKSFVLEVLADKPGCTTRFHDLPGKPIEDFVLAGLNCSPFFEKFAAERLAGSDSLYSLFIPALEASNIHKSKKYINLGLLEIMFNTVAARLECDKPDKVVDTINKVLKAAPATDVQCLIEARELGWSTSTNPQKQKILSKMRSVELANPYEFKAWLVEATPTDSASYQWGDQALDDWPILSDLFERLQASKQESLLGKIKEAYVPVAGANSQIKTGILADMTAAAIFLHLSFLK